MAREIKQKLQRILFGNPVACNAKHSIYMGGGKGPKAKSVVQKVQPFDDMYCTLMKHARICFFKICYLYSQRFVIS